MWLPDLTNSIVGISLIAGAAKTTTANGSGVDMIHSDFSFTLALISGTITDGTHTITVQESDDNSTFTTITAIDGNGITALTSSAGGSAVVLKRYIRSKRYVRAVTTVSGATTGGFYSAIVLASKKSVA